MKTYSTIPTEIELVPGTDDYFATISGRLFRFDGEGFVELAGWTETKRSGDVYRRDWISYSDGSRRKVYRHFTIARTFLGPKPGNTSVVCHGPGGSLDNSVGNLKFGTYYENNVVDRMKGAEYWERWEAFFEYHETNPIDYYKGIS